MKKMVLVAIIGLLVYGQAFSQSEPIMGYDKVKWGASVLDVRKAYNLGNSVVLEENYEKNSDIASLIQRNVSESIAGRQFIFNKYKGNYQLYRVFVAYFDTSNSTVQNLRNLLSGRFGDGSGSLGNKGGTVAFKKYSPELDVELNLIIDHVIYAPNGTIYTGDPAIAFTTPGYTMGEQRFLRVIYTWTRFRNEYQARGIGL